MGRTLTTGAIRDTMSRMEGHRSLTTSGGTEVTLAESAPRDVVELHAAFCSLVTANEGYPQHPYEEVTVDAFREYWIRPATASFVARLAEDGTLAGAYTMKPNGVGRAAHVANAGYFVVPGARGRGLGRLLVEHSMQRARAAGFDAMQFNFVFESNPARRLYERLGFEVVGRVPDVIDGEAVMIYWRRL
jgi:ribosomal protein S18 acetylase RimI-like enzyme